MRILVFSCFIAVIGLASCRTQKETINNYFEKGADTTGINLTSLADPVIQKNDLLSVKVYSLSARPEIDAMYNLPEQTVAGSNATSATAGFLVDSKGNIEYPRLGTIHAEGLKKNELAQLIKEKLDSVLKSPSVIVRFLNYRITVLGEVRAPGTFSVPSERVTILEALGLAGDITEFGNKSTVKILRENNGQASVQSVDLTAKDIFASPFYRLQQNDVVFVEQSKRKQQQQQQQNVVQQVGIATSIITAIALIINFIR
ncbi:MAG: polysaccharide export protein [Chitinophagaceae bacterium]|nr:MAG: polysaccharide export protein [Chitinophagaceae bacterium]